MRLVTYYSALLLTLRESLRATKRSFCRSLNRRCNASHISQDVWPLTDTTRHTGKGVTPMPIPGRAAMMLQGYTRASLLPCPGRDVSQSKRSKAPTCQCPAGS